MRLWVNQLVLQVSFNMCNYTALLILADRTQSPFVQAQFYAALTLPAFVFGLAAGPLVDMFDKKKVMIVSNFLLIIFFSLYIFSNANPILMMIIAFLTSSVARFFIPAEAAAIPRLVDKDSLEGANTFFIFTLLGSVLLGYAIAGPIIQVFGGLGTVGELAPFIIGSVLLIVALLFLLSLKKIPVVHLGIGKGTILRETLKLFIQTFREVGKNKRISIPLGLLVFVEFIVGMMSILLLEYVRRYLSLPITSVSYVLISPLVMGLITGVIGLPRIERYFGQIKSIFLALLLVGVMLVIMGSIPLFNSTTISIVFTTAAAFLMGIAVVVISVQSRTLLQIHTKIEMQGRIFSFLDILIALIIPLPVLVLGSLADKIGILWILGIVGGLVIAVSVISNPKSNIYARITRS